MSFFLLLIVAVVVIALITPVVSEKPLWRATVTPLASIIGSGFLILGPILIHDFGVWAPLVMLVLCALAWGFGAAIRANIQRIGEQPAPDSQAERIGGWMLSVAYMISVAYYLNLLGSFAVSLTPWNTDIAGKIVTTIVYGVLLILGVWRGFSALEAVEYPAVVIKLAVIAALISALTLFTWDTHVSAELLVPEGQLHGWGAVTLIFGLLITVQGFEISRYMGSSYSARQRVGSMKLAQGIATVIYVVYVALLTVSVDVPGGGVSETEIIALMEQVSPLLPLLLVVAALAAQFSAGVADTGGAGGLLSEVSQRMFSERQGYVAVAVVGLVLTWAVDVFTIIAIASRAFALYYAMQCYIAAHHSGGRTRVMFGVMGLMGLAAALLGTPVEGA